MNEAGVNVLINKLYEFNKELIFDFGDELNYEEKSVALMTAFSRSISDMIKESIDSSFYAEALKAACTFFVVSTQNDLAEAGIFDDQPRRKHELN